MHELPSLGNSRPGPIAKAAIAALILAVAGSFSVTAQENGDAPTPNAEERAQQSGTNGADESARESSEGSQGGARQGSGAQQSVGISPEAEGAELASLLREAQTLFRRASNTEESEEAQELYQRALYRFERIAKEGDIQNGALYYNVGNTFYRLDDIGRSILFYRRAQLYRPADGNLQHNLEYVRSQRADRLPGGSGQEFSRVLFFWHYLFSPPARVYIFAAAFAIAAAAGGLYLLRRERWNLIVSAAFGAVALLFLGSLVSHFVTLQTMRDGVIVEQEVIARKGDGSAYQRSFTDPLHAGTEFTVIDTRPGWYRIELTDGRTTWIPESAGVLVRSQAGW